MVDWCILRTAPSKTLDLARSLAEAGFDVWSPIGPVEVREGPYRSRREVQTALMPGYVLARADRLSDLLEQARSPALLFRVWDSELRKMVVKGHPAFSVHRGGNHRLIPDGDLTSLRGAEHRPKVKKIARTFAIGEQVRTDDAGFSGLVGKVIAINGKMVTVAFPRWDITPQFGSWLLRPIEQQPLQEMAA